MSAEQQDRERVRATLASLTPPPGDDDVVLTRWVVVSEHVAGDGTRYCRVQSGDHDDLQLASWDAIGLISYALEKARMEAWETDDGFEQALDEDDEADS